MHHRFVLIGFGEAGAAFARDAGWSGQAAVWDVRPDRLALARECSLAACENARDALRGAKLILSLVTANEALAAAQEYAKLLQPGALWCDMNSVAPQTKRAAAEAIESVGGRYADVAIMAPVVSASRAVPLLIASTAAQEACQQLAAIGFADVRVVDGPVGRASAIKMLRSVMVKGIEALTDEMMRAAEAAGVASEVLTSLDESEKRQRWAALAAYNRERMATHGARRAAEMEEAVRTLEGLGVDPVMTRSTVLCQRAAARLRAGAAA